jgi:superfamily II DNA or RNA helicase
MNMSDQNSTRFFDEIRKRFLAEVKGVESVNVPEWQLVKEGHSVQPSTMQKMTAYQMTQNRTWGNWAGAGAGKTAAAGLAAYATDSHLTVVIAVNSTLLGWGKQLREVFKGAQVVYKPKHVCRGRGMFLILNYEKFQQNGRALVKKIVALNPNMIVLDEIQLIKHRAGTEDSLRRCSLLNLLGRLPRAKVLCMSATPVINDLTEGISLLQVAADKEIKIDVKKTINNALSVYYELLKSGLRYHPQYTQKLDTKIVTISKPQLANELRGCDSILSLEQKLLPARLEAVKSSIHRGTIIYTEYVEEMADPIVQFVQSLGFSAARYTGDETAKNREEIQRQFVSGAVDVLVGSRAIAVGVDGLQERCNRMIFISLPWTHAFYEQTIGRVYRQGSTSANVEVIVPQVLVPTVQKTDWSWCEGRWSVIESKRTLSECATDGIIPNLLSIDKQKMLNKALENLKKLTVQ